MRERQTLRSFWAELCGAALIVLCACSDNTNTQTGSAGISSGRAGEVVLRRGSSAEPSSLDPHFGVTGSDHAIIGEMLMGLTTQDASAKPIPGAAESWETSPDGKTWTFHLRDHQWSDGASVTANDFIYSWRRVLDPKTAAPYASILYVFKNAQAINANRMPPEQLGARAIDDKTLELQLEYPAPYLPELLSFGTTLPVPSHVIDAKGRDWTEPGNYVSNGPYVLAERIPNDHLTLVKNSRFYDAQNVSIDRVMFLHMTDTAAGLRRFRAGELDVEAGIPTSEISLVESTFGSRLHKENYLATTWLVLNLRREPFDDIRVRQAMNLAYDRDTMAYKVVNIGQLPAYSIITPGIANYPAGVEFDFKSMPYPDRVKRAQELMREAGFGPDKRLRTTIAAGTDAGARRRAVAVQEFWRSIYIDTEMVSTEAQGYFANLRTGNFDIAGSSWLADYNDPRNFLFQFLSGNELNFSGYKNPAYDALIHQSDQEQDLVKRGQILAEAEAILLKEVPVIPNQYLVTRNLVQPYVKGWTTNVMNTNRTRWLSIERPEAAQ
jgi:oligopeptide transport system substrate-binding protein